VANPGGLQEFTSPETSTVTFPPGLIWYQVFAANEQIYYIVGAPTFRSPVE
jgi:hypothetical protein